MSDRAHQRSRLGRVVVYIVAVTAVLALLAGVGWLFVNPHRGEATAAQTTLALDHRLSREDAVADLDYLVGTVEDRHVWAASGLPDPVEQAWRAQVAALPESPTVVDVWRASGRILTALGDGHTFSAPLLPDDQAFGADLRIVDGQLEVRVGDGHRPVAQVNGVDVADLFARNRALTPADNDGWVEYRLLERFRTGAGLALLDAPPDGDYVITYQDARGGRGDLVVEKVERTDHTGDLPSAEYAVDGALAVLTVHTCIPDDTYRAALAGFFEEVHAGGLQELVVDLRGNGGGDSHVVDLFVEYLDVERIPSGSTKARFGPFVIPLGSRTMEGRKHAHPYDGEILVLTDHSTFSSATDFATVLSDNDLAQVIGEPPGSAPTGAGDVVVFELPTSGLFMQVSYKHFQRPDPTLPANILEVDRHADPTGSVEAMIAGDDGT